MPKPIDPLATIDIVLAADEGRDGERPTFVCGVLSCRQYRQVVDLAEQWRTAADEGTAMDRLFAALRVAVRGWRNLRGLDGEPIVFDPDRLEDVLGVDESGELLGRILRSAVMETDDAKKSGSPRPSGPGPSAASATADAGTGPVNANPWISSAGAAAETAATSAATDTGA